MKTAKYKTIQILQKKTKTVQTLLNELFVLDNQDSNEQKMRQYANDIGVTIQ